MNKKVKLFITILLVMVLAGIIAYPKIKPVFASKSKGPAKGGGMIRQSQQILNVSGFIINPTQVSELIVNNGTLKPDEEVELAFETSGKIIKIYFTEGTRVKKGDLLAKINDLPLQAQLQKLQAAEEASSGKRIPAAKSS